MVAAYNDDSSKSLNDQLRDGNERNVEPYVMETPFMGHDVWVHDFGTLLMGTKKKM